MRKIILLCLLNIFFSLNAQVFFGSIDISNLRTKKEYYEKFIASETIFIIPSYYDKPLFEKIVKESWSLTPYKIVKIEEFDYNKYINEKYSFAIIDGTVKSSSRGATYFYTHYSFLTFDIKEKQKELEKLNKKPKDKQEKYDIFENHRKYIAGFYLYQKGTFIQDVYNKSISEISALAQTKDVFYNFTPGLIKNYFQTIQEGIKLKEDKSIYDDFTSSDLKKLKSKILYIPNYVGYKYNAGLNKLTDTERTDEEKKELFSEYKFNYEFIDDKLLSDKILKNEDIYYLRYVRMNSVKFLNIVEAKTGKIIYSQYKLGFNYNLTSDIIKDISKAIDKSK